MSGLTIGTLAKHTGFGIETIRYYERRGLIEDPARRPSGYRDYPPSVVKRLLFIQRAKELGFSLSEIGDLLSLRVDEDRTCRDVLDVANAKLNEIGEKMVELERMRNALQSLASDCTGEGPTGDCPFLEALESEDALRAAMAQS